MPLEVAKLTVELPLLGLGNPPELCYTVPEPFPRAVESRTLLEQHHVARAEFEPVAELTTNLRARVRCAVLREVPLNGGSL